MKIKQQVQIKAFLVEQFGEAKGKSLFDRQTAILNTLIGSVQNKSKSQRKTLAQTILPCIALYRALSECGLSQEDAYGYVQTYMLDKVAVEKHASTTKMELVPGFYAIYSAVFLRIMRTAGLWESTQTQGRDFFDVTITKCLWHTACGENGCPELCRLFCDADNVTYGGLRKIGFPAHHDPRLRRGLLRFSLFQEIAFHNNTTPPVSVSETGGVISLLVREITMR